MIVIIRYLLVLVLSNNNLTQWSKNEKNEQVHIHSISDQRKYTGRV
jgi:hypothetical protein